MSTFAELQKRLAEARHKRAILLHLIDHVDSDFRPTSGSEAKKVLLTDEKDRVPPAAFEDVVEALIEEVKELENEIASILASTLNEKDGKAEPVADVKKGKKGKRKEKASERDDAERSASGDHGGNGKANDTPAPGEVVQERAPQTQGT